MTFHALCGILTVKDVIKMEKVDIKEMVKLNHILSLKHYWVKFKKEGDYDVYIVPINKGYDASRNHKRFEISVDYSIKLGLDAIIDETMMCYHLYKK